MQHTTSNSVVYNLKETTWKKNILNLILKTVPRFFFSNFDKNKLGKPVDTTGKSALKSTQLICKIWKWLVLSERRYSSAKLRKFMDVHTNVCKISRLWGAVSSMVVNKSLSNLAILLILRRSFHWCRRFCPNLLMPKVEKKWKGLLDVCWQKIRTAACASNSNTSNINSNISRTVPRPFLSYCRGEFVFKSKHLILGDHLLYSQNLFVWLSCKIIRRN